MLPTAIQNRRFFGLKTASLSIRRHTTLGILINLECQRDTNLNVVFTESVFSSRYREVAASSLTIVNVRESDHGSYQCRAENMVESLDAVAELIVQGIFATHEEF